LEDVLHYGYVSATIACAAAAARANAAYHSVTALPQRTRASQSQPLLTRPPLGMQFSGQRLKFTPQHQLAATANAVRNSSTLFVSKSAR